MRLVTAVGIDALRSNILGALHGRCIRALQARNRAALDCDALHVTTLRIIIVHRVMLRRAIVPYRDGVQVPVMAELIFRHESLLKQNVEQRTALGFFHTVDGNCELRIDEQRLSSRHRMNAYDGMQDRRIFQLELLQFLALLQRFAEQGTERLHVMDRVQPGNILLHLIAEAFIGGRHADEHCVAADCGHFLGDEDRRHRGLGAESLVGMPDVSPEWGSRLIVAKFDQFGCVLPFIWREGMHGQIAEPAPEGHQLLRRDVLVTEDDQLVVDECLTDRFELGVQQRLAKVDA